MEMLAGVAVLLLFSELVASQSTVFTVEVLAEFIEQRCDAEHEHQRVQLINAARCGTPREVLLDVPAPGLDILVKPQAVFVRRCVGVCPSTKRRCLPLIKTPRMIPVRYSNVTSRREWCAVVPIVEHEDCGCLKIT